MNNVFFYDASFEGLLSAVFEAYVQKQFPDDLLPEGAAPPLFAGRVFHVATQEERSRRVWAALEKKLSPAALRGLELVWFSAVPGSDLLLFRYIRKAIDAPASVETDFGDPVVLRFAQLCRRVSREVLRLKQFLRFQKAADGTYFAASPTSPGSSTTCGAATGSTTISAPCARWCSRIRPSCAPDGWARGRRPKAKSSGSSCGKLISRASPSANASIRASTGRTCPCVSGGT